MEFGDVPACWLTESVSGSSPPPHQDSCPRPEEEPANFPGSEAMTGQPLAIVIIFCYKGQKKMKLRKIKNLPKSQWYHEVLNPRSVLLPLNNSMDLG